MASRNSATTAKSKPASSPERPSSAVKSRPPFHVGPSNVGSPHHPQAAGSSSTAATSAVANSKQPPPAYIAQRKAPRAQQQPDTPGTAAQVVVPLFRAGASPFAVSPRDVPTLRDGDPTAPPSDAADNRSASPTKYTVVPCVAHPVYTKHQNCGCLRSRSGSPTQKEPEAPKPKFRWDDLMPAAPVAVEAPAPSVFEAPQKLVQVKGLKHLRHVAATGALSVLATEANGGVVQARHSVTGACLPEAEATVKIPKQTDVPVTAMTAVGDKNVWCGHLDGSVRIYGTDGLVFEAVKHSGAVQCFCVFTSENAVYAGSADWYITRWTQSGLTQWKATMVGGHTLGVRALCEAVTPAATYLCSAGDDAEIRVWLVAAGAQNALTAALGTAASPVTAAAPAQSNAPTAILKKHQGAVLSCAYAFGTLWSGGEDATVRRWNLADKRQVSELKGHTSAVLSIHRVGNSMWTLGKDGQGIMYDGETAAALHTMAFFDPAAFSKVAHRLAAQLFYVQPVTGHVLWVSDPAGETAAWYAPTETQDAEPTSPTNRGGNSGAAAFEESERMVAMYFEADAAQRRRLEELTAAMATYTDSVEGAMRATTAHVEEHLAWLLSQRRDDDSLPPPPLPPPPPTTTIVVETLSAQDQELIQELRRQLKAALEKIAALQSGDALQSDAVEELRTIALSMQEENRALVAQLDSANARALDLETSLHAMREAMTGDQFALNRRNAELEAKLNELRLDLDAKEVDIAALRAALAQSEQPSAEVNALKGKLQALEQEKEKLAAINRDAAAAAARSVEQIEQLKKDVAHREQLLDKLLLEKEGAVAKMSQQDVDAMTALANARGDIKRLQTQLDKANQLIEALVGERDRFTTLAEQRESEIARLHSLSRDRDREEVAVRQSYEARIAELVARLKQYDDHSVDGKLNELSAANNELRKKLGEFTSPRYVDLLSENTELKRQLGEHRDHITRLLQHDQRLEAMIRDLRERAAQATRDAFDRRSSSPKPSADHPPHDMSSPHHRETCIWCSGAVTAGVGTTLLQHKKATSPDKPRSRSRSPQVAIAMAADGAAAAAAAVLSTTRSLSAPETLTTMAPPPSSAAPAYGNSGTSRVRGVDFNGSPRTVERRKEKRVAQLKVATESTANEAVKAALIDQILAIHQQVVATPTQGAATTPDAA